MARRSGGDSIPRWLGISSIIAAIAVIAGVLSNAQTIAESSKALVTMFRPVEPDTSDAAELGFTTFQYCFAKTASGISFISATSATADLKRAADALKVRIDYQSYDCRPQVGLNQTELSIKTLDALKGMDNASRLQGAFDLGYSLAVLLQTAWTSKLIAEGTPTEPAAYSYWGPAYGYSAKDDLIFTMDASLKEHFKKLRKRYSGIDDAVDASGNFSGGLAAGFLLQDHDALLDGLRKRPNAV